MTGARALDIVLVTLAVLIAGGFAIAVVAGAPREIEHRSVAVAPYD